MYTVVCFLLRMGCPPSVLPGPGFVQSCPRYPSHVGRHSPHLLVSFLIEPISRWLPSFSSPWNMHLPSGPYLLLRILRYQALLRPTANFTLSTPLWGPPVTNGFRHLCLSVMPRVENCARRWKLTWVQRTKRLNYSITSKYLWAFPISK